MLINTSPRRPNRERVRHIKEALRAALSLPDGTTVTVTPRTPLTPKTLSRSARRGGSTSKSQYSHLCSRRTR